MEREFIKIHSDDNVAVALRGLRAGDVIDLGDERIFLREDIPRGHKFALVDLAAGEVVVKYGAPVGLAKAPVRAGEWVHVHNMRTALGEVLSYSYQNRAVPVVPSEERFFQGFRRGDGRVGVRNEIWIIPTVGCVNSLATAVERKAQFLMRGSIEAIAAFPHPYGCSQMGDDQENTRRILADLICHPNAGGVLVLGLGCENSSVEVLKRYIGPYDEKRVKFLVCQETEDEIGEALKLIRELVEEAGKDRREPVSCQELVVGMKCGGSDGLSGITANPTVGAFSDLLISKGGTTILTEVPEMFGAETQLLNRCENEALFEKTAALINDFKEYFISHNQAVSENPSPGNREGGITTLEEKSMGCIQKSGSAPVRGVLAYGERVREKGLNLLSAPGNDLVAATALAASGAQIVLFTTGRGTPFASPVPTVKISSNSALFRKKGNWIDFDCGVLAEGVDQTALRDQLFEFVIAAASGEKVKSEKAGYHDMAIFKQGVTL